MPPPEPRRLLSEQNRNLVEDLGIQLGADDRGVVLYGCPLSGRNELARVVADRLQIAHQVEIDVASAPRDEAGFLRLLGNRLLAAIQQTAIPQAVELLKRIADPQDLQLARECLRDGIRELQGQASLSVTFLAMEVVETSHRSLDDCFAALRDILPRAGIYSFVVSFSDIPKSLVGVSHFANNFPRAHLHPVKLEEIAGAWPSGQPVSPAQAAELVARECGLAEIRVQKALKLLEGRREGDLPELRQRLRTSTQQYARDARKFWEQLNQESQEVLRSSLAGLDSSREQVGLLMRHPWAHYGLRASSEERVEFLDWRLQDHVQQELLKHLVQESARPEQALQQLAEVIRDGSPVVAVHEADALAKAPGLSDVQRRSARVLRQVAASLERVLCADYPGAAAALRALGEDRNEEARDLIELWQKLPEIKDTRKHWGEQLRQDSLKRLALELARGSRQQRLEQWTYAFKDIMVVLESVASAALAQHPIDSEKIDWSRVPAGGREHYIDDLKACGINAPRFSERTNGGLEMLWVCRAFDVGKMRELRIHDLQALFQARTKTAHSLAAVRKQESMRAFEVTSQALRLLASAWNIPLPEGKDLLWPDSLVAAQLAEAARRSTP